jgi:putative membrane protein
MSLAAERTYLAYVRTGLAFAAGGVAVASGLPHSGALGLRRGVGVGLVVLSATVFAFAKLRLTAVTQAMRNGDPLPPSRFGSMLTVALMAVAVAAVIVILAA